EHGVGPGDACLVGDAVQREVAGGVEDIAEFPNLAAGKALEEAKQAAGQSYRIRHIAHDEFAGRVAAIEEAIELLSVAAGGKGHSGRAIRPMDARSEREELDVALHMAQLAGHAGDAVGTMFLRLGDEPRLGLVTAFADDAGDLGDFATE